LPAEADAQVVRCAILLDELDDYAGLRRGGSAGQCVFIVFGCLL
jgi:hypothetical protein